MADRFTGYNHGQDDYCAIDARMDPEIVLKAARAAYPTFNPHSYEWTELPNQGRQGSCAGHALSNCFQVALVQQYGIHTLFSRAAAYYTAQRYDGIKGDRGATLNGCQKVAESGLCLETEWAYPSSYNNSIPESSKGNMNFTMSGSRRVTDADLAWDLLMAGVPIQTGVAWNSSFEQVVCDNYRSGGGGHSTMLFGIDEASGDAWNNNSWGSGWGNNGRNRWTKRFFNDIVKRDRYAVFVAYDSTGFDVPDEFATRF